MPYLYSRGICMKKLAYSIFSLSIVLMVACAPHLEKKDTTNEDYYKKKYEELKQKSKTEVKTYNEMLVANQKTQSLFYLTQMKAGAVDNAFEMVNQTAKVVEEDDCTLDMISKIKKFDKEVAAAIQKITTLEHQVSVVNLEQLLKNLEINKMDLQRNPERSRVDLKQIYQNQTKEYLSRFEGLRNIILGKAEDLKQMVQEDCSELRIQDYSLDDYLPKEE